MVKELVMSKIDSKLNTLYNYIEENRVFYQSFCFLSLQYQITQNQFFIHC